MLLRNAALTVFALCAVTQSALAQSADEVAGVWVREGKTPRYYVLEKGEDGLTGKLSNPPFETMSCDLALKIENGRLVGSASWTEKVGDKEYKEATAWEFKLSGDELRGRAEAIDWEEGVVYSREWVDYTLKRVERKGLVTSGEAEEAFGEDPGALGAFVGGWKGPGGPWAASLEGDTLTLTAVGHHDGVAIPLKNERGTFRGEAKIDGVVNKLELGWSEEKLAGRSSWTAGPVTGWAPVSFERLTRTEVGSDKVDAPAASEGPITGVWKRDDGLYLRVRNEGDAVKGALSEVGGKIVARVTFTQKDGVWHGLANWGSYETSWELSVAGGALTGRCEWVDLHDGKLVAKGWGGRTFTGLKRLN